MTETQMPRFCSIREFARLGILSEYALRMMARRGDLPGLYVGREFKINMNVFLRQLNGEEANG